MVQGWLDEKSALKVTEIAEKSRLNKVIKGISLKTSKELHSEWAKEKEGTLTEYTDAANKERNDCLQKIDACSHEIKSLQQQITQHEQRIIQLDAALGKAANFQLHVETDLPAVAQITAYYHSRKQSLPDSLLSLEGSVKEAVQKYLNEHAAPPHTVVATIEQDHTIPQPRKQAYGDFILFMALSALSIYAHYLYITTALNAQDQALSEHDRRVAEAQLYFFKQPSFND